MDSSTSICMNMKITTHVPLNIVRCMAKLAEKKIRHEGWAGRNIDVKIFNFLQSWMSEEAWKDILGKNNIKYQHNGFYVGPVEAAPSIDFTIWRNKEALSIGVRNRFLCQLEKFKELPYPNDRVVNEPEKISNFIVLSSIDVNPIGGNIGYKCTFRPFEKIDAFFDAILEPENGVPISFYGAIQKKDFLDIISKIKPLSSSSNQELFRPLQIRHFELSLLEKIIKEADKI